MDLTRDHTLGLNLYAALRKDHTVKTTCDDNAVPFDLPFYLGILSEHNGLFGNDVALHMPVNAKRSGNCECALQRHTLVNKSCPLFADTIARRAGPLPRHEYFPRSICSTKCIAVECDVNVRAVEKCR